VELSEVGEGFNDRFVEGSEEVNLFEEKEIGNGDVVSGNEFLSGENVLELLEEGN
jgi:hypothetical protein